MYATARGAFLALGATCGTPTALARRMGLPDDEAHDVIAGLDAEGLLETDEADGGLILTLSPHGAATLGLRPGRSGWEEADPAWAAPDAESAADVTPYPTVFLAGFLWDNKPRPHCLVCEGKILREHEYCDYCDAWGRDPGQARRRAAARARRAVA